MVFRNGANTYIAVGTLDAVIVEIDSNGGVIGTTGIGTSNQITAVLKSMSMVMVRPTWLEHSMVQSPAVMDCHFELWRKRYLRSEKSANQANSWAMVSGTSV